MVRRGHRCNMKQIGSEIEFWAEEKEGKEAEEEKEEEVEVEAEAGETLAGGLRVWCDDGEKVLIWHGRTGLPKKL